MCGGGSSALLTILALLHGHERVDHGACLRASRLNQLVPLARYVQRINRQHRSVVVGAATRPFELNRTVAGFKPFQVYRQRSRQMMQPGAGLLPPVFQIADR